MDNARFSALSGLILCSISVAHLFAEARTQEGALRLHPSSTGITAERKIEQKQTPPLAKVQFLAEAFADAAAPTPRAPSRSMTPQGAPERERAKHTITHLLPVVDQGDIHEEDKQILHAALLWFPPLCRENLRHLVVRYDPSVERGQASSDTILLRGGMSRAETIAVLFHECAHIGDLAGLSGAPDAGESPFPDEHVPTYRNDPSITFYAISWETSERKKQSARETDFVSGYAKADPFEDMAESVLYYAFHNRAFRERAALNPTLAAKLAWIEEYIFTSERTLPASVSWDEAIVWDVTKLPYTLPTEMTF